MANSTEPATNGVNGTVAVNGVKDDGSVGQLQVVDENQKFTDDMPKSLKEWGLADAGFNYNVVAVFGSQSTGKSTLLNRLFGTNFAMMEEYSRQQTTKGIWMSRGRGMKVLIMDVEGTDGRERGEDQDFERKSALFSIATSEVIIVNLWEHQVGLYQGANMGLLKTVFEVNLQLFQAQKTKEKTLLFFVIRDHVGTAPLTNLSRTLQSDMERIWFGISKPEGLENCQIHDYFDFMYAALPHKMLQPDKFDEEVSKLRTRFTDREDPNFVFLPHYHKRVPADGLDFYSRNIWEKIMSNKDLDLPTQQELLAQYRCDEISSGAFETFTKATASLKRPIESGQIFPDLGQTMLTARTAALKTFDISASRYHAEVYKRKRNELLTKANSTLHAFFMGQLKNLHKKALSMFIETLQTETKKENLDFLEIVQRAREESESFFSNGAKEMVLEETGWDYDEETLQLDQDFGEVSARFRVEEMKKLEKNLEKQIDKEISESLSLVLNNPGSDAWTKIMSLYLNAVEEASSSLQKRARSFNSSETENTESVINLEQRSWTLLRRRIDEELADSMILLKLRNRFEEKFRYDEKGLPRVWKPEDDIDSFFSKAKDETLKLIPIYSKIDLSSVPDFSLPSTDDFDFDSSLIILSESKQVDLISRFKRESDAFFLEAKRSTVVTTAKVPYWLMVLLVVLGWNEFVTIISSPIYLVLVVFFGVIGYVIYVLNMWGPVEQGIRMVLAGGMSAAMSQIKGGQEKLQEQGFELKGFGSGGAGDSKKEKKDN